MGEKASCKNNKGKSLLLAGIKGLKNSELSRFAQKSPFQCRSCCGPESQPGERAERKDGFIVGGKFQKVGESRRGD